MLGTVSRAMEAHGGWPEGDRGPDRAAAEAVRALKDRVNEVRSFRATLAAYSFDRANPPAAVMLAAASMPLVALVPARRRA